MRPNSNFLQRLPKRRLSLPTSSSMLFQFMRFNQYFQIHMRLHKPYKHLPDHCPSPNRPKRLNGASWLSLPLLPQYPVHIAPPRPHPRLQPISNSRLRKLRLPTLFFSPTCHHVIKHFYQLRGPLSRSRLSPSPTSPTSPSVLVAHLPQSHNQNPRNPNLPAQP